MKIDPSDPQEIPEETLVCDICGQRFDTVESLNEHKLSELSRALNTGSNNSILLFYLFLTLAWIHVIWFSSIATRGTGNNFTCLASQAKVSRLTFPFHVTCFPY